MASLLFSGLADATGKISDLRSMNLERESFEAPETSRCIEWREGFSRPRRDEGLKASAKSRRVLFSWPGASKGDEVGATGFPESGAAPKTRFKGLFGDARVRDKGLDAAGFGLAERTESLTLGWKGVEVKAEAKGVVEAVVRCRKEEAGACVGVLS